MPLIPKVMSTQHPDNATPAPNADERGVLKGEGEVAEAVSVFAMGCDEQMWDSEGKEADNQVVRKLLTNYPAFFRQERLLGRDIALTLRVPNPRIERDMRKSMVEALQSVPSAWDTVQGFYGDAQFAPIQEVILPMTTSAEEISLVEAYYRKIIVGQEDRDLLDGQSVKDWVGEFLPKRLRVIPLIEDMEHILHSDRIVEEYVRDRDLPYQRVFLARSDPALNYGIVGAELILKVGLLRLHNLERKLGIPLYPIIGAGSVPFRGHLTPVNVERAFTEYPTAQTFTVQSAFKYDYGQDTVRNAISQIHDHERGEPVPVEQARAVEIIEKTTAEYQSQVQRLADTIRNVSSHVPKRRERKMHVGLFGYGRSLGGVGGVTLPRAIGFSASLYSIGVPPELLGLGALDDDDFAFVREVYPSLDGDLRAALQFANERHVKELLGDPYMDILGRFTDELDRVHEGLTSAIWASLNRDNSSVGIDHYIQEAAHLRLFLG
ncbi:MAG: phosphoenolpyruvate carboxylase [Dehalococcoidia bacterium]|nr:phosphoenolpyruvate carboxylase [Dehalococcoidia bacterium]